MNVKKVMGIGLLGMAVSAVGVSAFGGHGPEFMQDSDVQSAVENNDYDAFIDAVQDLDADAAERITEDVFSEIVERHENHDAIQEAVENEDYDTFADLVDHDVTEEQFQDMIERRGTHEAIKDAVEAGDYDAWVEAVSQTPFGEEIQNIITEDDFSTLQELHELKAAGNHEEAKALAEDLGLPKPPQRHGGERGPQGFDQQEQRGPSSERGERRGPPQGFGTQN